MSNVIAFRRPEVSEPEECEIDLMTAVDVAIRDLADITRDWASDGARAQAEECRRMLSRAYRHALGSECEAGEF